MVPLFGFQMPTSRRARVDLPAPDGPMMPTKSPGSIRTFRLTSTSAGAPNGAKLTDSTLSAPFGRGSLVTGSGG
jgi:hypothetical protein